MPAIAGLCRGLNRARWTETNLAPAISPIIGQFSESRKAGHPVPWGGLHHAVREREQRRTTGGDAPFDRHRMMSDRRDVVPEKEDPISSKCFHAEAMIDLPCPATLAFHVASQISKFVVTRG